MAGSRLNLVTRHYPRSGSPDRTQPSLPLVFRERGYVFLMIPRAVCLALVSLSERLLAHNKGGLCLTLVSLSKRPLAHGGQLTSMCSRIITKPNLTGKGCLINKILAVFFSLFVPYSFLTYDPERRITADKALQHLYFSVSARVHFPLSLLFSRKLRSSARVNNFANGKLDVNYR